MDAEREFGETMGQQESEERGSKVESGRESTLILPTFQLWFRRVTKPCGPKLVHIVKADVGR